MGEEILKKYLEQLDKAIEKQHPADCVEFYRIKLEYLKLLAEIGDKK